VRYALQRFRNYLLPSDYRCYSRVLRDLRARDDGRQPDPARSVLLDLTDPRIDKDKGRYAFNLVRELVVGGFTVHLAKSFWFLSSFHRKPHKRLVLGEPVRLFEETGAGRGPALLLTDRARSPFERVCTRAIHLDLDSRLHRTEGLTVFPFRPHPDFTKSSALPPWPDLSDDDRPVPVTFLGHWRHRDYDNTEALSEFGVLGRRGLVDAVREGLSSEELAVVDRGTRPEQVQGATFVLGDDPRLPDLAAYARWLRRSGFFLCAPGTGYPMCHNLVESMLLGCLPIVQRPELTGFPLVDGESCFAFSDAPSLVEVVRRCRELSPERVTAMRAALREVVRDHVEPGSFAQSLDLENGELPRSIALLWFERA
jgi:hypothetical protein